MARDDELRPADLTWQVFCRQLALLAFKRTYNEQWMLQKYDYRSPAQVRRDLVGLDAAA